MKCFCLCFYKFIPRDQSQAVSSWHKTALGLPSVITFFFSFLPQFDSLVTFVIELCFYSIFLSRKSLLKGIHVQVSTPMCLVYVF